MLKRSLVAVRDSLVTVEEQRKVVRDVLPDFAKTTYINLDDIDTAADQDSPAIP